MGQAATEQAQSTEAQMFGHQRLLKAAMLSLITPAATSGSTQQHQASRASYPSGSVLRILPVGQRIGSR